MMADDAMERGERTPLLTRASGGNGPPQTNTPPELPVDNAIKEKAVAGFAGIGCKYCMVLMAKVASHLAISRFTICNTECSTVDGICM